MTKNDAIEVLIQHAKRCPEPEPTAHGCPEDIRDDFNEWMKRVGKVNEAVKVLSATSSTPSSHVCPMQEGSCGECS